MSLIKKLLGAKDTQPFPPGVGRIYASELCLDDTCEPCRQIDGKEYASLAEAERDYPRKKGYKGCAHPEGCRGSLVFVSEDESPATM